MPVLGTKLHVPAMRRRLVPRPRLTGRLRGDPSSLPRLVLVSAPAGFGKTTLLAQWLASGERGEAESEPPRVAWLSLDAEDSELRRFLTHLVAAIQTSSPEVGAEALALLESGRALPTEAVLVSLVNDLDELAGPTVLALDDYHVIDAPDSPRGRDVPARPPPASGHHRHHHPRGPAAALGPAARPAASSSSCAPPTCASPPRRPTPSSITSWASTSIRRTSPPSRHRTEGWAAGLQLAALSARGRTGIGDPVGWAALSTRSPAATASSWTTWSRRCSTASPTTFAGSSSTPPCSSR